MILSFRTKWSKTMPDHMAGKPTRFPEKIWQSFDDEYTLDHFPDYNAGFDFIGYSWNVDAIGLHPKKHTIRRDEKNRWKAGNDIHFAINVRTKNQFQFAPIVPCVSTQKINISYVKYRYERGYTRKVVVDGKKLSYSDIYKLAINDGFDSVEDFFDYFNTDFTGKLIHWTDLKY